MPFTDIDPNDGGRSDESDELTDDPTVTHCACTTCPSEALVTKLRAELIKVDADWKTEMDRLTVVLGDTKIENALLRTELAELRASSTATSGESHVAHYIAKINSRKQYQSTPPSP